MALRHLLGSVLLLGSCALIAQDTTCEQAGHRVVHQAERHIDVRELTGRNDGPEVGFILQAVDLPEGYSWCGALVYLAHREAGVVPPGVARAFAWAPTWHPVKRRVWVMRRGPHGSGAVQDRGGIAGPRAGDVFGLWNASMGRIAHVGIVELWGPRYATTIEGNTNMAGSREGDGVYRKRRRIDQLHCVSRWTC